MDSPRDLRHKLNSDSREERIPFKRLISANIFDSAEAAAVSEDAMIFKSSDVPSTFSKCAVNKPFVEDAAADNDSKLRPIELIIGYNFKAQN